MSSVQAFPIVLDNDLKHALDTVVARVSNDLPASERAFLPPFVAALYHDVAAVDFALEPAGQHAHRVQGLWTFGRTRDAGAPQIRLYTPPSEGAYWRDEVTFIEIINDDMPFLVDSISTELARLGIEVRLLLHPVFRVARDETGALTKLTYKAEEGTFAESWMQITIARQTDDKQALIKNNLLKVLADVRLAVADWREMCAMATKAKDTLPASVRKDTPEADVKEAQAFLDWALDNHFVFLGVRHYEMMPGGDQFDVDHSASRGLLRDPNLVVLKGIRRMDMLPEEVRSFLRGPDILFVNKAQSRSTVHRPGHYDIIGVKQFDDAGKLKSITAFVGLFTSTAYSRNAEDIPWLCRKIDKVLALSGLDPKGHSGKALTHILNTYPRDDLFQISPEALFVIARGVLSLTDRQRTALFVWKDPFRRFVSSLIYVPRDRFDTALRKRIIGILESAFAATASGFYLAFSESPLVRLQVILDLSESSAPDAVNLAALEKQIIQAARGWSDSLADLLVQNHGSEQGLRTAAFYADAFPSAYSANETPEQAVDDINNINILLGSDMPLQVRLLHTDGGLHLRLFHKDSALPLSDVLPQIENMGLRVVSEQPYEITPKGQPSIWVHDFEGQLKNPDGVDVAAREPLFADAVKHLYAGNLEDDSFNRLVLQAGLNWREVTLLRSYGRYLQQARYHGTQGMLRDTLATYPAFARGLVELFHTLFDPARQTADTASKAAELVASLEAQLEGVTSLAQDEVLRRYLNLVQSSLRTNYYQTDAAGLPKSYLSIKLDSQKVTGLPAPRPWVEIWVYSPRVEGVHLRGGKVARGGLRWSDRRDDFRTEVLGLVKAQMVKNAVIVPVGSKGGFYCKKLVAGQPRAAEQAEVIASYQTFIRGLLDITDNMVQGSVVPPQNVVRLDKDDPYLVVAADKGTATFSDIANALSIDYGFWLGDAFASGGSVGYDHKAMGITARGAWESIKRHFRELDLDIQTQPFTCVGVGDMSGDVFGNGMLCSPFTKLVAAFNHKHIFIDPTPDVAVSYAERKRLFTTPGTAWSDYKPEAMSQGGAVYERSAKSITLSPEAVAMLGLPDAKITPNDLIRTLLTAKVDLLYLGGIGTYIKASTETHADVSDKANDAVRVDAKDLQARVLGEGANLGSTAKARIEFARKGGHLNSDAVDNSAGVDTSDHEVNIKIALQSELSKGSLTMEGRNAFLATMTDDVAHMVLQDNYLQTQMLSVEETRAPQLLDTHVRLMRQLEKTGLLNREVENLPSDAQIAERSVQLEGLTRPELAILMAYAKIALFNQIDSSTLPDDAAVESELTSYFPPAMRSTYPAAINSHRLRREIIGTVLCNEIVNRMGPAFVGALAEQSGRSAADVARAYVVISRVFDLPSYWAKIEALDNKIPAALQLELLRVGQDFAARAITTLVIGSRKASIEIAATIEKWQASLKPLLGQIAAVLPDALVQEKRARATLWESQGVPAELALWAARLGPLAASPDILHIAEQGKVDVAQAARAYYQIGARLGLDRVQHRLASFKAQNVWQQQEALALLSDLRGAQIHLATDLLSSSQGQMDAWTTAHSEALTRYDRFVTELASAPQIDLAMVSLLTRSVSGLV